MKNWIKRLLRQLHYGKNSRKSAAEAFKQMAWRGSAFFAIFGAQFSNASKTGTSAYTRTLAHP
ncbi:MAG: hypothetical protein ACYC9J_11580 [Sulfuricaulis sp.]